MVMMFPWYAMMLPSIARCSFFALCGLFVVSCSPEGLQRQDQYVWALNGFGSTSTPIVRIELVTKAQPAPEVRCFYADTFVEAVRLEKGYSHTEDGAIRAMADAAASRTHRFRFDRLEALDILDRPRGIMDSELAKGCQLIEAGKSAQWADRPAMVLGGPRFPLADD
ncbi:hypothetical protein ACPVPU_11735 [Sphingomonas sp. CJ99]